MGRPKNKIPTPCSTPGCKNCAHARGLCKQHYNKTRTKKGIAYLQTMGYSMSNFKRVNKKHK